MSQQDQSDTEIPTTNLINFWIWDESFWFIWPTLDQIAEAYKIVGLFFLYWLVSSSQDSIKIIWLIAQKRIRYNFVNKIQLASFFNNFLYLRPNNVKVNCNKAFKLIAMWSIELLIFSSTKNLFDQALSIYGLLFVIKSRGQFLELI